ncbi:MAG TPA: SDR family oxidoreductase [Bryobacteraceae bacterium]|nr:SDR family oxidoreductase [Bryobacteraceae bacterium]
MPLNLDFAGKCAVVTGGANGIGLAMAKVLAGAGARTWIFDLERERPGEAAAAFGAEGRAVDVTDRAALDRAFAETGAPDVLMVNAGTVVWGDLAGTPVELWDQALRVNLTGAFLTMQAAAGLMLPRRSGAVVITASTNSFDGEAHLSAYNATKAGLLGLLHTAANEWGPYGIRVNAVCPGIIRTRLSTGFFDTPKIAREYFRQLPLGRGGTAEEVAHAAAFLASDLASFITGTTLCVDGGQMTSKFATWNDESAEFVDNRWRLR